MAHPYFRQMTEDAETSDSSLSSYAETPVFNNFIEPESCASTPAYDYPSTPEYGVEVPLIILRCKTDLDADTTSSADVGEDTETPIPSPSPYYEETPTQNSFARANPGTAVPTPSVNPSYPVPPSAPVPHVPQGKTRPFLTLFRIRLTFVPQKDT